MTPSPRPSPPPGTRCALALAALAVATGLGACSPDAAAGPPETPTASGTPSAAASEEPTPGPQASASPTPEPDGLAAELAAAVSSGDTAPIEALLSEPTRVVIAASEADVSYSAVDAVLALDYIQPGVGVWDFELAPTVVAGYAASPFYGEFFTDDAVVGRSDTGAVVAFVPNGKLVGTIFMAIHESVISEF